MSKTFTDNQGQDWVVFIDTDAAKRVRHQLDVNLLEFKGDELLARLAGDMILLVDVLYVVCKEAADTRGINDRDFGRRLCGDPIDGARIALLRAIIDFFPKRRQAVLAAVVDKIFECEQAMQGRAEDLLASGVLDRVVAGELAKADEALTSAIGGSSSTSAPVASKSTRGRSRSPS